MTILKRITPCHGLAPDHRAKYNIDVDTAHVAALAASGITRCLFDEQLAAACCRPCFSCSPTGDMLVSKAVFFALSPCVLLRRSCHGRSRCTEHKVCAPKSKNNDPFFFFFRLCCLVGRVSVGIGYLAARRKDVIWSIGSQHSPCHVSSPKECLTPCLGVKETPCLGACRKFLSLTFRVRRKKFGSSVFILPSPTTR